MQRNIFKLVLIATLLASNVAHAYCIRDYKTGEIKYCTGD